MTAYRVVSQTLLICCLVVASAAAQPARSSSPQKTGEIVGVVALCGGQSTVGTMVYIPGESFQAKLSATGRFALHYVPVGTYSLVVEVPGRPLHTIATVVVADNKITDLGAVTMCRDADGDGVTEDLDCNDNNPAIRPGVAEVCQDGVDNNCNATVDEGCLTCTDADGDSFFAQAGCGTAVDCNDASALIRPTAVEACDGLDNNCNGTVDETFDLATDVANCGACGNVCSVANATSICADAVCTPDACLPAFGDCDGTVANGCEASLDTNLNCGACGNACAAGQSCVAGACVATTCSTGFEDCNGDSVCDSLRTNINCGACGTSCNLANASESCTTGTCELLSCNTGFGNCDSNATNGCEKSFSAYAPPNYAGSFEADAANLEGLNCQPTACVARAQRTGTQSQFVTIGASEESVCAAFLGVKAVLEVPAGADYDLYGSGGSCLGGQCSSTHSTGLTESVILYRNDTSGAFDDFDATFEVRYRAGASCQPWTLTLFTGNCQ